MSKNTENFKYKTNTLISIFDITFELLIRFTHFVALMGTEKYVIEICLQDF